MAGRDGGRGAAGIGGWRGAAGDIPSILGERQLGAGRVGMDG